MICLTKKMIGAKERERSMGREKEENSLPSLERERIKNNEIFFVQNI
jgi:hypothetical protein